MGKFKIDDRLLSSCGAKGTVVGVSDTVTVLWDGWAVAGTWPAENFELLPRKFAVGQYVRVVSTDPEYADVVGFLYEDDGDEEENAPYSVSLFDDFGTEENFSASELIPWVPLVGERVIEAGIEDEETGTVVGWANSITARVLWDSFPLAQDWLVADLEPADESEDDFENGDIVVYSNPMFSGTSKAVVTFTDGGEAVAVKFEKNSPFRDGVYHRDFFSIAA